MAAKSVSGYSIKVPVRLKGRVVFAVVDEQDSYIDGFQWMLSCGGYAFRKDKQTGRTVLMHRQIMGLTWQDGNIADHINRVRLDNRRCNLRLVDHCGNQQNRSRSLTANKSGVIGVRWRDGKWVAKVQNKKKKIELGRYATKEEAEAAVYGAKRALGFLGIRDDEAPPDPVFR